MPKLLIHHQGIDVERWHQPFLDHLPVRRAHGAIREVILHNPSSPAEVWILIEWDDLYRAQLFARSDDLQDQLDQSGITQSPDMWFLESLSLSKFAPHSSPTSGDALPLTGNEGETR